MRHFRFRPLAKLISLSFLALVLCLPVNQALADEEPSRKAVDTTWRALNTQTDIEYTDAVVHSLASAVFLDAAGNISLTWDTSLALNKHHLSVINSRREQIPAVRLTGIAASADSSWFICGEQGILLETRNWGKNWKQRYFPGLDSLYFYDLAFASGRFGVLVGVTGGVSTRLKGIVYRTEDGGATWQPVPDVPGIGFSHVTYNSDHKRFYITGAGVFLYSDDYGRTWELTKAPDGELLRGTVFDGALGIAHGMGGRMLTTSDAGATWTEGEPLTESALIAGHRSNPGRWHLAGEAGEVWFTEDWGKTWTSIAIPKEVTLNGIQRIGPRLVVWGNDGTIMVRAMNRR